MREATSETANTSTGADTTETTTDTGASADATATRMRKNGLGDIVRIATDTDRSPVQGHHTGVPMIETATSEGINRVVTEIAAHLAHVRLVEAAMTITAKSVVNRTPVQDRQAHQDRSLVHPIERGEMSKADIRDDAHHLMTVEAADLRPTARHLKRRNATRQRSKPSVKSVWLPCSQMRQSWKAIAERVLRILRREMQSNARRTIARDLTRPTLLVEYVKKPRELILEGGCKAGGEAVTKTSVLKQGLSYNNNDYAYLPITYMCVVRSPGFIAAHNLQDRCRP
jgi:hypothetical protein